MSGVLNSTGCVVSDCVDFLCFYYGHTGFLPIDAQPEFLSPSLFLFGPQLPTLPWNSKFCLNVDVTHGRECYG